MRDSKLAGWRSGFGVGARSAVALLALVGLSACKKEQPEASASPAVSAAADPAAAAPAAPTPLNGLDPCLSGQWKATGVTLHLDTMSGGGGANVLLDVGPSGQSVLDFTPMADVEAKSGMMTFSFRYAGKASGTLATPQRGSVTISNGDFSALKVSAKVKFPGGASVPILKETPATDLAQMAAGLAGAAKGAASSAAPAGGVPKGIDANPVFSASSYSCAPGALTLKTGNGAAEWAFVKR